MTFFRNCALSSMPPPHNAKAMVNMAQLFSSVSTYLDYRKGYSMVNGRRTHLPSPPHFPDLQISNFRFSSSFPGLRLVDLASLRRRYSPASHTVTAYSTMLTGTPSHSAPSPDTDIHLQAHKTSLMIPTPVAGFRYIVSGHGTDPPSHFNVKCRFQASQGLPPKFRHVFQEADMVCLGYWSLGLVLTSPSSIQNPDAPDPFSGFRYVVSTRPPRSFTHAPNPNLAIRPPHLWNKPRLFRALLVISDCSPSSPRLIHESPSHQRPTTFLGHFASFWTPALPVQYFIRHPAQIPRPATHFSAALITIRRALTSIATISTQIKLGSRAVSTPFKFQGCLALCAGVDSILPLPSLWSGPSPPRFGVLRGVPCQQCEI
ncbi:hypothetical protein DFP72DRAFT_847663 [Ephemerocybe angulata]|uniref:Uncharacterized protein n=1 Tax=Ephemerocybe angulata TaxID=980116 RepID=A0A8H6HZ24_9AGAR|nr:hypothetical protein DFP72DRAFT_847663 [Tulosesus angulatus]